MAVACAKMSNHHNSPKIGLSVGGVIPVEVDGLRTRTTSSMDEPWPTCPRVILASPEGSRTGRGFLGRKWCSADWYPPPKRSQRRVEWLWLLLLQETSFGGIQTASSFYCKVTNFFLILSKCFFRVENGFVRAQVKLMRAHASNQRLSGRFNLVWWSCETSQFDCFRTGTRHYMSGGTFRECVLITLNAENQFLNR